MSRPLRESDLRRIQKAMDEHRPDDGRWVWPVHPRILAALYVANCLPMKPWRRAINRRGLVRKAWADPAGRAWRTRIARDYGPVREDGEGLVSERFLSRTMRIYSGELAKLYDAPSPITIMLRKLKGTR